MAPGRESPRVDPTRLTSGILGLPGVERMSDSHIKATRFWLALIALILVIAAMRQAQTLVVQILLATFVALVASPQVFWLKKKGLPVWLAVGLVVVALLLFFVLLGLIVGGASRQFSAKLPFYREQLLVRLRELGELLGERAASTLREMLEAIDPSRAMSLALDLINGLSEALTNVFVSGFVVILMLFELTVFPDKLHAALPDSRVLDYFDTVVTSLKRYFVLKVGISLLTGVCVGIFVAIVGLDFAVLCGLLAFLLNFIPNIGSILAAVPAVLLALIQLGPGPALVVVAGYVAINMLIGNVIEPSVTGQGVGLSTLVVFLSLVFWGWVLGPVGMLLSVPMTMAIKIALESSPQTRWAAVLISSKVPEATD